jgi:hypothetical protein
VHLRKLIVLIATAAIAVAAAAVPVVASADNPHAGNSGHFSNSVQPCQTSTNNPNCPPFGP